EQSNELLAKAASISQDPTVHQMSGWMKQFESQRQEFASERHKQYEKAVGDVHKLIDNHKESFALDAAARASLLAQAKKAPRTDMLTDALKNARTNYYKPVEYKDLLVGGIKGLRALATTKGLEQTFAGLGDDKKRDEFLADLDKRMADLDKRITEAKNAGTE